MRHCLCFRFFAFPCIRGGLKSLRPVPTALDTGKPNYAENVNEESPSIDVFPLLRRAAVIPKVSGGL